MKTWNCDNIAELLLQGGMMAIRMRKEGTGTELKADRSVVTAADKAVEKFLCDSLVGNDDNVYFLGEESVGKFAGGRLDEVLQNGVLWIVDPIDGTANYASWKSSWGVSIGYAVDGVLREGGIFLPDTGEMLISEKGETWFGKTDGTFIPEWRKLNRFTDNFDDAAHISFSQKAAKKLRFDGPNSFISTGCCLQSGMEIALGREYGYVTLARLWDFAGFLIPLANLGAVAVNRSGKNLVSGTIDNELYCLDAGSDSVFMVNEINYLGISEKAAVEIRNRCKETE